VADQLSWCTTEDGSFERSEAPLHNLEQTRSIRGSSGGVLEEWCSVGRRILDDDAHA
jgi:hypothetical protein